MKQKQVVYRYSGDATTDEIEVDRVASLKFIAAECFFRRENRWLTFIK